MRPRSLRLLPPLPTLQCPLVAGLPVAPSAPAESAPPFAPLAPSLAYAPGMPADVDAKVALGAILAEVLAPHEGRVGITGLRRLSGGASRETWSFDCHRADGTVLPLILRRDPLGTPASQVGAAGMGIEGRLLTAAAEVDVPVPRVLVVSDDVSVMGSAFIVMDRIEGETIPRKILRDPEWAPALPLLAGQCGTILANLHSMPADIEGLPDVGDPVQRWRTTLDTLGQPHPAFELVLRWLDTHRPVPTRTTVVHGDFRNGNLIVGPEGVRAVLDWELAHRGDAMEDLGWLCVKSWRFGQAAPVGGFGTYEELVVAYEAAGGDPVDRAALHWWETLGTLAWGIICIVQTTTHTSGMVRSVELAAIGRRVCEVEWDVLRCLELAPGFAQ